jgi:hypothetical protein
VVDVVRRVDVPGVAAEGASRRPTAKYPRSAIQFNPTQFSPLSAVQARSAAGDYSPVRRTMYHGRARITGAEGGGVRVIVSVADEVSDG